jgi:hypothetical protein
MSRLRKFMRLSHADRVCLLEAGCWLGFARVAFLVLPFRLVARGLGMHMAISPDNFEVTPIELLDRISWSVAAASRHLPWECTCLAQAMAAKAMLKCRGVSSTLYLGVAKQNESNLQAHAWLRCGERILTGGQAMANFTVIATFAEGGS